MTIDKSAWNYDRIPEELKQLVRWIGWKYEARGDGKPTKVPVQVANGFNADVTNLQHMNTFEAAVARAIAGAFDGLGFCFVKKDGFFGVDFDDVGDDSALAVQQQQIHNYLNTYSEWSVSGTGVHAIGRGVFPNGRKRSFIEMYCDGRYFTFTGNVLCNSPINERQDEITKVWESMGSSAEAVNYAGDMMPSQDDDKTLEMILGRDTENGELARRLWAGDWAGYPSNRDQTGSSEADFALIDIIAKFTKNRTQIQRLFLQSKLGQREKYTRCGDVRQATLIGYMVSKSFDLELPPVDLSKIFDQVEAARAHAQGTSVPAGGEADASPASRSGEPASPSYQMNPIYRFGEDDETLSPEIFDGLNLTHWRKSPGGLLGAIGHYIYQSSPVPIYEIAITGALALMAGICGRGWNVEASGLNIYTVLLAPTGTGKEAMQNGISRLLDHVIRAENVNHLSTENRNENGMPAAALVLGPGHIASGQALLKNIAAREPPAFLSIIGEVGLRFQEMTIPNASPAERALERVLLDLFSKTGFGAVMPASVFADADKNTKSIIAPAFSFLGESVAENFYKKMDESNIASGFLPRLLIVEYDGGLPPFNFAFASAVPPDWLIRDLRSLIEAGFMRQTKGRFEVVKIGYDKEGWEADTFILNYARKQLENSKSDAFRQLWNRVHLKTRRIAGLLAISDNPGAPTIRRHNVEWASSIVISDTVRMSRRFAQGLIGEASKESVSEQEKAIKKAVRMFYFDPLEKISKVAGFRQDLWENKVIPRSFLQNKIRNSPAFRGLGSKALMAMDAAIKNVISNGHMQAINNEMKQKLKTTSDCYVCNDLSWLQAE